jgi:POT family proton-dependent oligopeptide transporter
MTLGVIQYVLGRERLGDAGRFPADLGPPEMATHKRRQAKLTIAITSVVLVLGAAAIATGVLPMTATQLADAAGYLLLGAIVVFFAWALFAPSWTPAERRRNGLIFVFFLGAAIFFAEFEQAGSTLNLFADRSTDLSIGGWEFPSSWLQSVNSIFIILFAPVFAWLWIWLGRRRSEPSGPAKLGFGLALTGAGFAVLAAAAIFAEQGIKVSPMWLVVTYFLHTCGELCLSPVGLSAMSKLAPVRLGGLIMGVWFLGVSAGNYVGGRAAAFYEAMTLPMLFGIIAAIGIGFGLLLLLFSRPLSRLEHAEALPIDGARAEPGR